MRYLTLFLATMLMLVGCASAPAKRPVCSGNTLRACHPVIYFNEGSTVITPEAEINLNWVYEKMVRFSRKHVRVTGYADAIGRPHAILTLAMERALAVREYLIQKGIEKERIEITYMDNIQPMCDTVVCQELTRRAELDIYTSNSEVKTVGMESDL